MFKIENLLQREPRSKLERYLQLIAERVAADDGGGSGDQLYTTENNTYGKTAIVEHYLTEINDYGSSAIIGEQLEPAYTVEANEYGETVNILRRFKYDD